VHDTELITWLVLLCAGALLVLAYRFDVPYPILLVVGGLALGFIPGVPHVELDPDLVLIAILPPLLYAAAFFSSLRDLRANLRAISMLSIGLVVATTVIVAVVAHAFIDDLSWKASFVLGAVVAPTDPVAATSILRNLGAPRRVVTVVEGESLVNDASALVIYKVAVAAVVSGSFSLWEAGGRFLLDASAGIAIGLAVGFVIAEVRKRIEDAPTEIVISILTPYLAYLPASELDVSAVLAAVTVGIYKGWNAPWIASPSTRLQSFPVWGTLVFLLNAALFTLLGLQLHSILDDLSGFSAGTLIGYGALVSGAVILTRLAWIFPLAYGPRFLFPRIRARDPYPGWRPVLMTGWTGMRGAVSLAAALAIPLSIDAGGPFPGRELIIFLTYCVILATLLLQGLTLPWLIIKLGVEDDGTSEREEAKARIVAAMAAIEKLNELESEEWVRDDTVERMRGLYAYRERRFRARYEGDGEALFEERSVAYQRLQREILEAQRAAVVELRNQGKINDEVMHRVERDLDLEDSRLEI
jgi:CPA1 family monovalent cation:H+ antiporter